MDAVTLTEADSGRSLAVAPGTQVVLRLPENPTTGYRWQVPPGVTVASDEFLAVGADAGAGAGGERVLTLVALATPLRVTFELSRPGGGSIARRFVLDLTPPPR